jgi:hypothetical protein
MAESLNEIHQELELVWRKRRRKKRKPIPRVLFEDSDFIKFQDDFYNLLEKYGVSEITGEHPRFNDICNLRNNVAEFIEEQEA